MGCREPARRPRNLPANGLPSRGPSSPYRARHVGDPATCLAPPALMAQSGRVAPGRESMPSSTPSQNPWSRNASPAGPAGVRPARMRASGCPVERGAVAEGQLLPLPGGQPVLHPGHQCPLRGPVSGQALFQPAVHVLGLTASGGSIASKVAMKEAECPSRLAGVRTAFRGRLRSPPSRRRATG